MDVGKNNIFTLRTPFSDVIEGKKDAFIHVLLLRPLCKCSECDTNDCPHIIKIKKHDCLHITEDNVDYVIPSHRRPNPRRSRGNTSDNSKPSCSISPKIKCGDKKGPVLPGLLDGIKQDDCNCEVVARAIADNPRHLGLATLRESINEGNFPLDPDLTETDSDQHK